MTRETAQKHRKEINAFADGKDIQTLFPDGTWQDCPCPAWTFSEEYRIKPREPREFTIWVHASGDLVGTPTGHPGFQQIRVREILPVETP